MMTGNDVALVIAAVAGCTGVVTAAGNFLIQWKSLQVSQSNSKKLDINTMITEAANKAAAQAVIAANLAVQEAKQIGVVTTTGIANVSATLKEVQVATDGITEKLVASAHAQGQAEGHLAAVVAEQTRLGETGVFQVKR